MIRRILIVGHGTQKVVARQVEQRDTLQVLARIKDIVNCLLRFLLVVSMRPIAVEFGLIRISLAIDGRELPRHRRIDGLVRLGVKVARQNKWLRVFALPR